jgi:hypothetical protein
VETLELRILSPVFFARFVHYAYSSEAFDRECVFTNEKNRTIWLSRPDVMYNLIKQSQVRKDLYASLTTWPRKKWQLHKSLRCPPPTPAYPSTPTVASIEDIRESTFSELDRYVMASMRDQAPQYLRLCSRVFLAQRLAFGFVPVIDFLELAVRFVLSWNAAGVFSGLEEHNMMQIIIWTNALHTWALVKR